MLQAGCKALWEPVYTRAANCTLEVVRDPINCPEVGGSWEAREQCWPVQGGLLPPSGAAFHRAMAFLGGPAQGRGGGKGCRTLRGAWTRSLVWDGAPSWALELTLLRPPAKGI